MSSAKKLAAVFARQDFYEACKRRDSAAMIAILNAGKVTQGQIAARTGLAQSTLSNYKRGVNTAQFAATFEKLADGLDMPPRLRQALGLTRDVPGGSYPAAGAIAGDPADTFDLQLLAEAIGRNGTKVKRRDMLALAAQLGATAVLAQGAVWERLAYALANPGATDEATVREMEARTAGFHHLEEIVTAPALLKGLTAHLREVSTLLSGSAGDPANELRRRLMVVAGESTVLAGWAASDMREAAAARNFYDTAMQAANQAGDPAIASCALAYRSYIPSTKGANGRARVLLTEALQNISETTSPATVAWIAARHAEESAQLGDQTQALASWGRAEEAFAIADPDEDRVWTRFLDQNRFDSYRIATYSRIGKLEEAQEAAAAVLSRLTQPDKKKAVIIFEDIAAAYLARGSVNEASRAAQNGLAVMRENRIRDVAAQIRDHRPRAAALAAAAAGPRLPRRVRHDQAPVRPVPALIRSCTAAACATSSSMSPILIRASRSGRRRSTPPKNPCPGKAARFTAGLVSRIPRSGSSCRRPATRRPPRNACTWTWKPTTWRPKSAAWRRSAPPGRTTRSNADSISGSCATRGATNSASSSRSSPNSWPGKSHGIPGPRLAD